MKLRIILSVAWITLLAVVAGAARAGKAPAPAATGLVAACESARHDGRADGPRGAAARSDAVVHGPALALPPL